MKFKIIAALILLLLCVNGRSVFASESGTFKEIKRIAIQEEGRIKPLDTFARETVLIVTGKTSLNGVGYWPLFLSWVGNKNAFENSKVVRITHFEYKKYLGITENEQYFSGQSIVNNPKFKEIYEQIRQLRTSNQDVPHDYKFQETEQAAVKIERLYGVINLAAITIVPQPASSNETAWSAIGQGQSETDKKFFEMITAFTKGDNAQFTQLSLDLRKSLASINPLVYPSIKELDREVHFNGLRPFRQAWVFYLVALLSVGVFALVKKWRWAYLLGVLFYLCGFVIHTYGFVIRSIIAGRAPVANMYESVIWVAWGAVLFSLIFLYIYKSQAFITGASVLSIISLILADNIPSVLNPSISPLAPVLRNNFWLTTHVLTITLSYAAFMMALGLGHIALIHWWRSPKGSDATTQLTEYIYRGLQVGVLLLTAGTILGGVWADYSWGRFWGWDPKEVWALIALLGYLAIIHGRYAGWLSQFGFAVGSIVGFLGVMMAWYGVNYVLGVGLHSYGFGGGGASTVALFSALDLVFVGIIAFKIKSSKPVSNGSSGTKPSKLATQKKEKTTLGCK